MCGLKITSAATTDGATGELVHLLVREFDREGREQLVNIVEPLGGGGSLWPWGRRGLCAVGRLFSCGALRLHQAVGTTRLLGYQRLPPGRTGAVEYIVQSGRRKKRAAFSLLCGRGNCERLGASS